MSRLAQLWIGSHSPASPYSNSTHSIIYLWLSLHVSFQEAIDANMLNCLHPVWKNPIILASSASPFFHNLRNTKQLNYGEKTRLYSKRSRIVCGFLPVDPWAPNIDSQSIASQLFAFSLFPYVGFLYFITKSKTAPKLTLFGFYFLLAFVGATSKSLQYFPCLYI